MHDPSRWDYRKLFALHLVCALLNIAMLGVVVLLVADWTLTTDPLPGLHLAWLLVVLVYALVLHGLIAWGAWRRRHWVFERSLALAAFLVPAMPFGTLTAVLLFVAMWNDRADIARRPRQGSLTDGWPAARTRDAPSP